MFCGCFFLVRRLINIDIIVVRTVDNVYSEKKLFLKSRQLIQNILIVQMIQQKKKIRQKKQIKPQELIVILV